MYEYNPAKNDTARAEAIRKQYMERGITKMDALEALHTKVKTPGMVTASIIGVFGSLVMGAGMSNIMVWDNMAVGLVLGIPGLVMMILAFPVYKVITDRRKKKYAPQIMELSGEILDVQKEVQ